MAQQKYVALRPFGYGDGVNLDRGQLFEMRGYRNDEKLVRLGYVSEYPRHGRPAQCGECGSEFVGDAERAAHGKDRHRGRQLTPEEEDLQQERRERMLEEVAPLKLENTIASRS